MAFVAAKRSADTGPRSVVKPKTMRPNASFTRRRGGSNPLVGMSLAALGVVFGDIGTSPLYTFSTVFSGATGITTSPDSVLGVLSVVFWTLTILISVKYVGLVLRADYRGEGGVLALTFLVLNERERRYPKLLALIGLVGCAFFYGDGVITPAISVLGAIEGIRVIAPSSASLVVPLSTAVMLVLFSLQRRGTPFISRLFGPVMLAWFIAIAALGATAIASNPFILTAVNPVYAVRFLAAHSSSIFVVLGAVFLAVTGGEALYADLAHFGRRPITFAWLVIAWPSLILNYFGQGALLLADPGAADNPFYRLAPQALQLPLVFLATAAAIIASQAVISGAFSVTEQCLRLGLLPRLQILHSSPDTIGQIYVPTVNRLLCVLAIAVVISFGSSNALGHAYGIAVASTMAIVTILQLVLTHSRSTLTARMQFAVLIPLAAIDLAFVAANFAKFLDGGWFPILFGVLVLFVMLTWHTGRQAVAEAVARYEESTEEFLRRVEAESIRRVPGTAVFLSSSPTAIPRTLVRNVQYNQILHDNTLLLTLVTEQVPHTTPGHRVQVTALGPGIHRLVCRVGFMETPDITALLREARDAGFRIEVNDAFYFLGRDELVVNPSGRGMSPWRKKIFRLLSGLSQNAAVHYGIPPNRILDIGGQLDI
jgi:KUP system potassium uptake protein